MTSNKRNKPIFPAIKILCFFLLFTPVLFFSAIPLFSQSTDWFYMGKSKGIESLPDNSEIRQMLEEAVFAPTGEALETPQMVYTQSRASQRVSFQLREQNGFFYFLFINEKNFRFPLYSRGSYIIKRARENGKFIQVKIFLRDEPDSFLRIFPEEDHSIMELYLAGFPLYRDILLPLSFEEVLVAPFTRVIEASPVTVSWELLFPPDDGGHQVVREMVEKIRRGLHGLGDRDDGAMDSQGRFVFINTLEPQNYEEVPAGFNCSGFAKWVIDGLYYPIMGEYISLKDLKERHPYLRGNRWSQRYEMERDPYFGLDWTRNLAAMIQEGRYPTVSYESSEGNNSFERFDIRNIPGFSYVEDVGFPVENLSFILYYLAYHNPGKFYLASVNREFGDEPVLRQHIHVAVLFPYFDRDGQFHAVVMERNGETSISSLKNRYSKDFIHLVGIEGDTNFHPPKFE